MNKRKGYNKYTPKPSMRRKEDKGPEEVFFSSLDPWRLQLITTSLQSIKQREKTRSEEGLNNVD